MECSILVQRKIAKKKCIFTTEIKKKMKRERKYFNKKYSIKTFEVRKKNYEEK